VYRSWELDKGQILQCTGAGNWTKVRYYSVQELGTGQRSDITVQELGTGQRSDSTVQELGTGQRSDITVQELGIGQLLQLASENRSNLGEFEAEFKKALARESGEQGLLF
jgi:hypothetical protein